MADFTPTQSISTQGLCATLISTDTTDYNTNTQGISLSDIQYKTWIFRDSSGVIIKQVTTDNTINSASCSISLLTLGTSVTLNLYVDKNPYSGLFSNQLNFLIPCLGV